MREDDRIAQFASALGGLKRRGLHDGARVGRFLCVCVKSIHKNEEPVQGCVKRGGGATARDAVSLSQISPAERGQQSMGLRLRASKNCRTRMEMPIE